MKNIKKKSILKFKWENLVYLYLVTGSIIASIKRAGNISLASNISTVLVQSILFLGYWYSIKFLRKNPNRIKKIIKELVEN